MLRPLNEGKAVGKGTVVGGGFGEEGFSQILRLLFTKDYP